MLALLSVTFGLVFADRFALVYLAPFLFKDLQLSNTQIGNVQVGALFKKQVNLVGVAVSPEIKIGFSIAVELMFGKLGKESEARSFFRSAGVRSLPVLETWCAGAR